MQKLRLRQHPDYQELLILLGVRLSEPSNFELRIADSEINLLTNLLLRSM